MNTSKSLGVLATLREVTALLAGLDLTTLPGIGAVRVHWDTDAMNTAVQLSTVHGSELDTIDAVRTWAVALGGVVLLGDEQISSYRNSGYRPLTAVVSLASGGVLEVWTHLHELRPAPGWTPADSDLIAA